MPLIPARCSSEETPSSLPSSTVLGGAAAALALGGAAWLLCGRSDPHLEEWAGRWAGYSKAGVQPGFHKQAVNPRLEQHLVTFLGEKKVSRRVLVPMAGKSLDLAYLAGKGHKVLGVEVVPQAVDEYIRENPELRLEQSAMGAAGFRMFSSREFLPADSPEGMPKGYCFKKGDSGLGWYRDQGQGQVSMALGNVFSLPSAQLGQFEASFDRGAFVALHPADRARYGQLMARSIKPGGRVFLIGLEHPPMKAGKLGPPYSTELQAVQKAFGKDFDVREVERWDVNEQEGWQSRMGTNYFYEVAYLLTRKL